MAYLGYEPSKVAVTVGQGVIDATHIQDASITTADLGNDSVTPIKIDDDGTGFQMGSLGLGTAVSGSHKLTVGGTATFSGNITGTLATAAQTNITSVGTLTGLTISGDEQALTVKTADSGRVAIVLQNSDTGSATNFTDGLLIKLDSDETGHIGMAENKALSLFTNGTTALTLDNSQNATLEGITTKLSNANAQLWVGQGDGNSDIYMNKGSTNKEVRFSKNSTGNLDILTNGGVIHLNSDGTCGIGTGTPNSYNSNTNNLVIRDSGSGGITISTGASNTGYLAFNDGVDTAIEGLIAYNQSNDNMSFRTAGTDDRLVIDGSGNSTFAGDLTLGTKMKFIIGGTSEIKHDDGSGSLTLMGDQVNIKNRAGNETALSYNDGGGVTFSQKIIGKTDANISYSAGQAITAPTGGGLQMEGSDIVTGRMFLQGYHADGGKLIGWNNESDKLVMYNYGDGNYMVKYDYGGSADFTGNVGINGDRYMLMESDANKGYFAKDDWATSGGSADNVNVGCYGGQVKITAGSNSNSTSNIVCLTDKSTHFNNFINVEGDVQHKASSGSGVTVYKLWQQNGGYTGDIDIVCTATGWKSFIYDLCVIGHGGGGNWRGFAYHNGGITHGYQSVSNNNGAVGSMSLTTSGQSMTFSIPLSSTLTHVLI